MKDSFILNVANFEFNLKNQWNFPCIARKGYNVTMKIIVINVDEMQKMFGHDFDIENEFGDHIT